MTRYEGDALFFVMSETCFKKNSNLKLCKLFEYILN